MIRKQGVLFFSGDDWSATLTTSKFHMATQLANDGYKVLYINSTGLRKQVLGSGSNIGKKILSRLGLLLRGTKEVQENIRVITPFVIPIYDSNFIMAVNRFLTKWSVKREMRRWEIRDVELWLFLPTQKYVLGQFDETFSLYYCVDEYTHFAGVDKEMITLFERGLIEQTNLLVATSKTLLEKKRQSGCESIYVPHGVDVQNFAHALEDNCKIPSEFSGRPTVGFFGLIENWLDLDLVAAVARRLPEMDFMMIGRVVANTEIFQNIDNVQFVGPRAYSDLAAYCKGFMCGIMPFKIDDMTVHVNPIKMREYLAAGLPVISTPMPEVVDFSEHVSIVSNADEFVDAIKLIASSRTDRRSISESVLNEDWAGRYRMLREKIDTLKLSN